MLKSEEEHNYGGSNKRKSRAMSWRLILEEDGATKGQIRSDDGDQIHISET